MTQPFMLTLPARQASETRPADSGREAYPFLNRNLEEYCGVYTHGVYGRIVVEVKGQRLIAVLTAITCPLEHCCSDTFELRHGFKHGTWIVRFEAGDDGRIRTFSLRLGVGVADLVFTRTD